MGQWRIIFNQGPQISKNIFHNVIDEENCMNKEENNALTHLVKK
jgi:hypothetical protein